MIFMELMLQLQIKWRVMERLAECMSAMKPKILWN